MTKLLNLVVQLQDETKDTLGSKTLVSVTELTDHKVTAGPAVGTESYEDIVITVPPTVDVSKLVDCTYDGVVNLVLKPSKQLPIQEV